MPSLSRLRRSSASFLLTGLGLVSMVALVGDSTGTSLPAGHPVGFEHFLSRPDLTPPTVTVTTPAQNTAPGYLLLAPKNTGGQSGPMIVDNTGEVVWFDPHRPGEVTDLRVQRYQGQPVLTWWEGASKTGHGQGSYVLMDASYRELARVRAGNGYQGDLHEFRLTSAGTALVTVYQAERRDLSALGGPRNGSVIDGVAQEIDVATGRVLFEWHSLDHVPLSESLQPLGTSGTPDRPYDYFHINSVAAGPDGTLLVSSRHTHAVYDIDKAGGTVRWRLGGRNSDFTMGPGTGFRWQHDVQAQPDGTITIFDNGSDGSDPDAEQTSRALRLRLDTANMRATLVHAYPAPDGRLATSQGNVQVLSDGHVLVGWGHVGAVTEFAGDGRVVFDATLGGGRDTDSYRAYRSEWTGRPTEPPVAVVTTLADGTNALRVSWNGATEVADWQLLTGPTPERLAPSGVTVRSGFETQIPLDGAPAYAAVRALDRSGAVLGSTTTLRLDPVPRLR